MRYIVACDSDVGAVRKNNQDAVAVRHCCFAGGEAVLAVLCDGMGGLQQGEVASSAIVMAYMNWFEQTFLREYQRLDVDIICAMWEKILINMNKKIYNYGLSNDIRIGTALTMLLLWNDNYYVFNVGDCRTYEFASMPRQITVDHSVVEEEVKAGRLTRYEARVDSRRNQLTRCIGASARTAGDFFTGKVQSEAVYMLCCDGVRTRVSDDELFYYFHPTCMERQDIMEKNMKYIFELNKSRNESDNMSVVLVKNNCTTIAFQNEENVRMVYSKDIIPADMCI